MKYNVGDKVIIRKDLSPCTVSNSNSEMAKLAGKTATITRIRWGTYVIDLDNGAWSWSDDMFQDKESKEGFNVGDIVTIRRDLQPTSRTNQYRIYVGDGMADLRGRQVKITSKQQYKEIGYSYNIEGNACYWTEDLFESKEQSAKLTYVVDSKSKSDSKIKFEVGNYMGLKDKIDKDINVRRIVKLNNQYYTIDPEDSETAIGGFESIDKLASQYYYMYDEVMLVNPSSIKDDTLHFSIIK